ncbi:hypothetical protein Mapa_006772 [Marchantia paleacea]|nr:hypothetical protein Mapa_006772 [Marchantia paleacea]
MRDRFVNMAIKMSSLQFLFVACVFLLAATADAQFSESFHSRICPGTVQAVAKSVNSAVKSDRRTAAGLLRGCDSCVLLLSTANNTAEKDADPNLSLQGFGFIDQARQQLRTSALVSFPAPTPRSGCKRCRQGGKLSYLLSSS